MANNETAAAIIAGGKASRLGGQDKSRLYIGGQTIISRQVAVLQPLTDDLFIVASQHERFSDLPFRVVPDLLPGTGVAGAILTALESTLADRVLTVACDLPFLDEVSIGVAEARAQRTARSLKNPVSKCRLQDLGVDRPPPG